MTKHTIMSGERIILHKMEVMRAEVISRPSKTCKSPYVADVVELSGDVTPLILAHSPSLGCCGLADKNATILMSKMDEKKNQKCTHRIELAIHKEGDLEVVIGINPKLGEKLAEEALKANCIASLANIKSYEREVTYMNSRFDFSGVDENNQRFIMEIKNVPLADYVDCEKKHRTEYISKCSFENKIAYFPDGYRKKSSDPISPRALKHIQELEKIVVDREQNIRCILCFVIQRSDVKSFTTSVIDPIYKDAVKKAFENGVEIKTLCVDWDKEGVCRFVTNALPVLL